MEVMLSPLTHIHGLYKFVIDPECCHSYLGGFKKKRNLNARDLCYQLTTPLSWIQ